MVCSLHGCGSDKAESDIPSNQNLRITDTAEPQYQEGTGKANSDISSGEASHVTELPEPKSTEENKGDSAILTDGTKTASLVTVYTDDIFIGWKVTQIESEYFDDNRLKSLKTNFSGRKEIKGELVYQKEPMMGSKIMFYVDNSSYDLFPYPVDDTRVICFDFSNEAEVINMINDKEGTYKSCEISIEGYCINFAYTSVVNSAGLLNFINLGEYKEIPVSE